jgi:hypothetical protein
VEQQYTAPQPDLTRHISPVGLRVWRDRHVTAQNDDEVGSNLKAGGMNGDGRPTEQDDSQTVVLPQHTRAR